MGNSNPRGSGFSEFSAEWFPRNQLPTFYLQPETEACLTSFCWCGQCPPHSRCMVALDSVEHELRIPGSWWEEEKVCSKAQKAQRLQMWKGETALVAHPLGRQGN